jgi:Thioredoxin-like/HEAT repeats
MHLAFQRILLTLCIVVTVIETAAAGEKPPPGPPWKLDFAKAQQEALERGVPIFIYFTKTVCPHCTVVEKELLTNPAIEPAYDKLSWFFVTRDFTEDARDRRAERVFLRFGITSYPHLLLVDPNNLEVLGETSRSVKPFLDKVNSTSVASTSSDVAVARYRMAEKRAIQLQSKPTPALIQALSDDDIVVQYTALRLLVKKQPSTVVERASELLQVPHDQFRFEVCDLLTRSGDRSIVPTLESILKKPINSRNPNVLRCQVMTALGKCGDASALQVMEPFAVSKEHFNGLTRISVDAVTKIGLRDPDARQKSIAILLDAFPSPNSHATCKILASAVHHGLVLLTEQKTPMPKVYDESSRATLIFTFKSYAP